MYWKSACGVCVSLNTEFLYNMHEVLEFTVTASVALAAVTIPAAATTAMVLAVVNAAVVGIA